MNEEAAKKVDAGVRFPFVSLEKAIARAEELYKADPSGREMAVTTAFGVWKYSDKSSGGHQTVGALKMYGLIKDDGSSETRKLALTDSAKRYFKDEREEERVKLKQQFAITPKLIAVMWDIWGVEPPTDTVARSYLKIERSLNEQASRSFLGIYKENLAFAEFKSGDKILGEGAEVQDEKAVDFGSRQHTSPQTPSAVSVKPLQTPPQQAQKGFVLMDGERILQDGILSQNATYRIVVSGKVGPKEIDRLIKKLELDKEILADQGEDFSDLA